jgi:hypothetical protein
MADDPRKSYPKMPTQNWWDIRRQFARSFPKTVDADYLQSILGLGSARAAANLLGPLRTAGLIDDTGKPLDRANDWRNDEDYPAVCKAILEEIYPPALRDAFPPPMPDREGVRKWFARNTRTGDANASQLATFYILLAEADPAAPDTPRKATPNGAAAKQSTQARSPSVANKAAPTVETPQPQAQHQPRPPRVELGGVGGITINIELQIPATADAKFFDAFFNSMRANLIDRDG